MSRPCRLLVALGLACLLGPLWAGGTAVVYLRPSALLHTAECTLGELATVAAEEPALQERLAGLGIGRKLLGPALVSAGELRRRIAAEYDGGVDLIGGRVAVIPEGSVPAGQEWFFLALLGYLDRVDCGPGGMELELLTRPALPAKPGLVEFSMGQNAGPAARLAGRVQLTYRVAGAEATGTAGLLVWVHSFLPVARAARDLNRGRVLGPDDVEYTEIDVSRLPARFLTATELSGPWRTLTPVARGQLLEPARLSREYLVKAGETVTVVFQRPGLSVSLPGKAFGSGGQGEPVEVRLAGSARRFRGRITGVGEVLVEQL